MTSQHLVVNNNFSSQSKKSWLIWFFSSSIIVISIGSKPCHIAASSKWGILESPALGMWMLPSTNTFVVTPLHLYCCCWIWPHWNCNAVSHFLCFMSADIIELPAFPVETWWLTEGFSSVGGQQMIQTECVWMKAKSEELLMIVIISAFGIKLSLVFMPLVSYVWKSS